MCRIPPLMHLCAFPSPPPQIGAGTEQVLISPLVIAGWCGLVTTALNALPAGSLDGGRMVQAAYGKQVGGWYMLRDGPACISSSCRDEFTSS